MAKNIDILYGSKQFILEMRALRKIKSHGASVEKAAVDGSLTHDFPTLRGYCLSHDIIFERSDHPSGFVLENGDGFYLVSNSPIRVQKIISNFQGRGFNVRSEFTDYDNAPQ